MFYKDKSWNIQKNIKQVFKKCCRVGSENYSGFYKHGLIGDRYNIHNYHTHIDFAIIYIANQKSICCPDILEYQVTAWYNITDSHLDEFGFSK